MGERNNRWKEKIGKEAYNAIQAGWRERNREKIRARYTPERTTPRTHTRLLPEDWREGLDIPMISPHLIPEGHIQEWNTEQKKYVLKKKRL